MTIAKRFTKHLLTRVPLAFLAFALMCAYAPAKESKIRGSRKIRSVTYFQARPQTSASDFYTPARSPGWNDETGS